MKIQTMIMLDGSEKYILRGLEEALNLVGWHDDRETKEGKVGDQMKSIRRVRSDMFAERDVKNAASYVRNKAGDLTDKAKAGGVFADPQLDKTFCDGIIANSQLATRRLERFLDDLKEMVQEHLQKADYA